MSTVEKPAPADNQSEATLLRVVQILQGIVDTAAKVDDVQALKSKLADCLSSVLEEVEKRHGAPYASLDPVTGLPTRTCAEEAILEAYAAEVPACVGVVAIDRLATLKLRFGNKVGDDIIRHYADILRQQLSPEDRIFAWGGTALVALLLRPTRIEQVRREFGRMLDAQYEHTVQTPSRAVHLPILPRWAVWPMMASPILLVHKVDSFASMQARGEPPAG